MSKCIIIYGASQVGKNTLADKIIAQVDLGVLEKSDVDVSDKRDLASDMLHYRECSEGLYDKNMPAYYITKYTTRAKRKNELGVTCVPLEDFPEDVDIRVVLADGNTIGYSSKEILDALDKGKYPFICTTSLEIIKKIEDLISRDAINNEMKIKKFAIRGYITSKELMIGKQEARLGTELNSNQIEEIEKRYNQSVLINKNISDHQDYFDGILDYFNYYGIAWRGISDPKFNEEIREMIACISDDIVSGTNTFDKLFSTIYSLNDEVCRD